MHCFQPSDQLRTWMLWWALSQAVAERGEPLNISALPLTTDIASAIQSEVGGRI
jgi:hypothetical protein